MVNVANEREIPWILPVEFVPETGAPPESVRTYLTDADHRVKAFFDSEETKRIPSFVASNTWIAWDLLCRLRDDGIVRGTRFCEWGSGFGVVTGLAALAGYEAHGIEREPVLVEYSRSLHADHSIEAEIHEASYYSIDGADDEEGWKGEPGLDPGAFDVIYAYPWPVEEHRLVSAFSKFSSPGAVLVTVHGGLEVRIFRRTEPDPAISSPTHGG